MITDFSTGVQALPNVNFEPVEDTFPSISASEDYDTFAQYLYNRGAFNVNSTSVDAWALFLASGSREALPAASDAGFSSVDSGANTVLTRFMPMAGSDYVQPRPDDEGQVRWASHRQLIPAQIQTLAENLVSEVKARGPFNRLLSSLIDVWIPAIPA